jgi:hypothetical protein
MTTVRQNQPGSGTAEFAKSTALYIARVLKDGAMYLGRTVLDLGDAIRRALLLRDRRKFPERAAAIDLAVATCRERKARRWSSWGDVPEGRRVEIRAAAIVIVIAAGLAGRAYLHRGVTSPGESASGAAQGYTPSPTSSPAAASSAATDSERARQFLEMCNAAVPGQWVVSGDESARIAQANIERAQAEFESAKASAQATEKKWALSTGRADRSVVAANRAAADSAEKILNAKGTAVGVAQTALRQAQLHPAFKPVLDRGELSAWDDFEAMSPVVIKEGSRYRMWYIGCHFLGDDYTCAIGHAQSRDGVSWQKSPAPVLAIDDPAVSQYLQSITLVRTADKYLMWYAFDSSSGHDCTVLDLATSLDGLSWQREGTVLSVNCGQYVHLWPSAVYDGKLFHLWYADFDSSPSGMLMHATSSSGKDWQGAGSTSIASLGVNPRRIWILPDRTNGYRALFAAPKAHFGMLRSADLATWQVSDAAPKLPQALDTREVELDAPAAIVEPEALRVWVGVSAKDGGAIALAFQKGGAR